MIIITLWAMVGEEAQEETLETLVIGKWKYHDDLKVTRGVLRRMVSAIRIHAIVNREQATVIQNRVLWQKILTTM